MKALAALFVAFLLVSATLQAGSKRIPREEKHKLMEQRNLLSDSKQVVSKASPISDEDDDQEKNPTFNSGNPSSNAGSHHVYRTDSQP